MRFVFFWVLFGGWAFMWWWTYVYHVKACGLKPAAISLEEMELVNSARLPVSFRWSEDTPVISEHFGPWLDSLRKTIRPDELLLIIGIAYRDETDGDVLDLAARRAEVLMELLAEKLPVEKMQDRAEIGILRADLRAALFPGFRLDALMRNQYLYETPDQVILYFPFDSTAPITDATVRSFFDDQARVLSKSVRPRFIHWVAQSDTIPVDTLAEWRMQAIADSIRMRRPVKGTLQRGGVILADSVETLIGVSILEPDKWFVITSSK